MEPVPVKKSPSDKGPSYSIRNDQGAIIPHANLQLIFWGTAWPQPPTGPSAKQITLAVEALLRGPYMSGLLQYGIGLGRLALPGVTFVNDDPANPLEKGAWHEKIWDLINQGTFPKPTNPGGRNLYMFILPPGYTYETDIGGAHGYPWPDKPPFTDIEYAWAGFVLTHYANDNDGGIDFDGVTKRLFHEIVEACTDPEDDGLTIDGLDHPNNEICDVCQNLTGRVDGFLVAGYWSLFDNACIIPTAFSLRRFMLMKGLDPSKGLRIIQPAVDSVRTLVTTG
jgi:hypothetical protein